MRLVMSDEIEWRDTMIRHLRDALKEIGQVVARDAEQNGAPPVYAEVAAIIGEALADKRVHR